MTTDTSSWLRSAKSSSVGNHLLCHLPAINVYLARETARRGDRDDATPLMRSAVNHLVRQGQLLGWGVPATGVLVETLLDRGTESDVVEAEAAIERLATAPAEEGLVIREIWLLRLRALLARAHGDAAAYCEFQGSLPRHGDLARLRGAHGMGRGDAMTGAAPSGVVTFLFTDVEGSTRRWEADADGMRVALAAHDLVLRRAIEAHGGWLFKHALWSPYRQSNPSTVPTNYPSASPSPRNPTPLFGCLAGRRRRPSVHLTPDTPRRPSRPPARH